MISHRKHTRPGPLEEIAPPELWHHPPQQRADVEYTAELAGCVGILTLVAGSLATRASHDDDGHLARLATITSQLARDVDQVSRDLAEAAS